MSSAPSTSFRNQWVGTSPRRSTGWIALLVLAAVLLGGALFVGGTYNRLVREDQAVQSQWAQVENAYQRRADLVPNLVATVKGAASFERETFTAVAEARSRVGQLSPQAVSAATRDPEAFRRYQAAQDQLGQSLSRLLVVAEQYPQLRATEGFRDLQAQLEGTENRITVERMRFNQAAQGFNADRSSFPTVMVAGMFGSRFAPKAYFQAQPGSQTAPKVQF